MEIAPRCLQVKHRQFTNVRLLLRALGDRFILSTINGVCERATQICHFPREKVNDIVYSECCFNHVNVLIARSCWKVHSATATRMSQHSQECKDPRHQYFLPSARHSICLSVCPVTAKTPRMEKPAVCLSRAVNVSRQHQRPQKSDAGKNRCLSAWLVRRRIATGKTIVTHVRSQQQYCSLSEDRHRLVVTRDLDL